MTLLKAENISCGYGSGDIVSGVSLELKSGEILSVAGKNGCGKTTLLRCLCGIIKPSSGHIEIDGEDISPLMGKNRRELAKKIEEEMEYPGQIKVHVLRETTAIEYAK